MEVFALLTAMSMGVLLVSLADAVGLYVVEALAIMRVLTILGYANPWMAWIPLLNYFALARVTADQNGNTRILGFELPNMLFCFWWAAWLAVGYIPKVGNLLGLVVRVICLGTCFIYIYSRVENKPEAEVQALGYVSGLIPIVAIVKFLTYDKNLRVQGQQFYN